MVFQQQWKIYETLALFFLLTSCNHLFYHPHKLPQGVTLHGDLKLKEIQVKTADHVQIAAVRISASKKPTKAILLHFHGNAQHLYAHLPFVSWLREFNIDVITFDYRGYGKSEGKPSPKGLVQDALAMIRYSRKLASQYKVPLIILGQSLGGAVAMRAIDKLEETQGINFLIIDSSFQSYKKVGSQALRGSWVTWIFSPLAYLLLSNEEAPLKNHQAINVPTLVIHDKHDKVVWFDNGEDTFRSLQGKKWFWRVEEIGHIHIFSPQAPKKYRKNLIELINKELKLSLGKNK